MTAPGNGNASENEGPFGQHQQAPGEGATRIEDFLDNLHSRMSRVSQPLDLRLEEIEQAVATVRAASAAATNYVRTKPLKALGIALTIGAVVGVIAGRRR